MINENIINQRNIIKQGKMDRMDNNIVKNSKKKSTNKSSNLNCSSTQVNQDSKKYNPR